MSKKKPQKANHQKPAKAKKQAVTLWRFNALDSWFFREARPMDALGDSLLNSVFPPPSSSLIGAVRYLIGEREGVDWHKYAAYIEELHQSIPKQNQPKETQSWLQRWQGKKTQPTQEYKPVELKPLEQRDENRWIHCLGYPDDLTPLKFSGVFLSQGNQRLYPVPAILVKEKLKDADAELKLAFLSLGEPMLSDLGEIRFPRVKGADKHSQYTNLQEYLMTEVDFHNVLSGKLPQATDLIKKDTLFQMETHVGIGRDNKTRTIQEGLLYQTQHVRPEPDVALEIELTGYTLKKPFKDLLRLGGEGRLAAVEVTPTKKGSKTLLHQPAKNDKGFMLINLFPSPTEHAIPLPAGFIVEEENQQLPISGYFKELKDIKVTIHSAIVDKALRYGGWNLAQHRTRPTQTYLPAGSVWFCTVETNQSEVAASLAKARIQQQKFGHHGQFAIAPWKE